MQALVAALGGHVKSALQRIEQSPTSESASDVVGVLASHERAPKHLIEQLFGKGGVEQVAGDVARKTGINIQTVKAILPVVLSLVMKLLHSGGSVQLQTGAVSSSAASGLASNPVLNGFLNSDCDGNIDLAYVMELAVSFLMGNN